MAELNPLKGALGRGMWQIYRLARPRGNRQIAPGIVVSLRVMARPTPDHTSDVTVYLVLNDYPTGLAYVETALDEADRETVIRNFLSGQYSNPLRVVTFNAAEGSSQDVSEDVANEVLDRAYDPDDTLSDATKRFIDRHVIPGEKRPPASSVRRGLDQPARKKA
jgi:hypothetical protein